MKTNITIFLLLLSFKSFAHDIYISKKEQIESYKEELANSIRAFNETKLPGLSIDEIINKLNTILDDSDYLEEYKSCKQAILDVELEISEINNYISSLKIDINENIADEEYCDGQNYALQNAELKLQNLHERIKILNDTLKMIDMNKRSKDFVEQNPNKDLKNFFENLSQDELRFLISMEEFLIKHKNLLDT